MSNCTITAFYPGDGVRSAEKTEQAELTSAGAVTTYRLTILARVTSGGKWCPYASNDSPSGANVPRGISLSEVVADGAGDDPVGVLIKGEVEEEKIRIYGGNAGENITEAIKDYLKAAGIYVVSRSDKNILDTLT